MRANLMKKVIEMSKNEAKKAGVYNSDEFKKLQELRAAFPTYAVEIIQKTKARDTMRGLTEDYMRRYIEKHCEDESIKEEFEFLCGNSEDALEKAAYGKLKKWFLDTFPEVEKQNSIMEAAKARRAKHNKVAE